jgi:carboxypeptidase C (cathepsin A)
MMGLITENGPFRLTENLEVVLNDFSWNKLASVIYLEAPVGVGFSYSNTASDYNLDDEITAQDNYKALQLFFNEFPQFATQPFYIAGESYAGHYVPQLAYQVVQGNNQGNPRINLVGTLSGNPCTQSFLDANTYFPFLARHAAISQTDYTAADTACNGDFVNRNPKCHTLVRQLLNNVGPLNPYNVYAPCIGKSSSVTHHSSSR